MMTLAAIILGLAAAGSAEAKPMPWDVTAVQSFDGRRLQAALMSPGCIKACPTMPEFLAEAAKADQSNTASMLKALCPHVEAMSCLMVTSDCLDEGVKAMMQSMAMIPCMCVCPGLAGVGELSEDAPSDEACSSISCVMGSSKCAAMQEVAKADPKFGKTQSNCDAKKDSADFAETTQVAGSAMVTVLLALFA